MSDVNVRSVKPLLKSVVTEDASGVENMSRINGRETLLETRGHQVAKATQKGPKECQKESKRTLLDLVLQVCHLLR